MTKMGSTTTSTTSYHPIVFLLLLSLIIAQSSWHVVDGRGIKTTIMLFNQLPQDSDIFKVHCFSKDNDLGYHDVSRANSPFAWSFSENFLGTTLFACHFWWGSKDKAFDVFGGAIHHKTEDPNKWKKFHAGRYYYYVRSDGVFTYLMMLTPSKLQRF